MKTKSKKYQKELDRIGFLHILTGITIIKTKEEARQVAIDYQNWASEQSLSYYDISLWQNYFETLAEKFDLKEEFSENGII